jgi:hypothetical protein
MKDALNWELGVIIIAMLIFLKWLNTISGKAWFAGQRLICDGKELIFLFIEQRIYSFPPLQSLHSKSRYCFVIRVLSVSTTVSLYSSFGFVFLRFISFFYSFSSPILHLLLLLLLFHCLSIYFCCSFCSMFTFHSAGFFFSSSFTVFFIQLLRNTHL